VAIGGLIAVVVTEVLDSGIRSRSDVEHRLGARYLGAIPDLRLSSGPGRGINEYPEAYIVNHPLSAFAESIRSLRTAVTLARRSRPKVLAITSSLPQEGKTTMTMCLARALAMSGASTVLIDCDLRRHSSSNVLLADREGLLLEVLAGTRPVSEALLPDTVTDLQILGCTQPLTGGSDPLTSDTLEALLAELRARFDYIVIDTAPLLGVADARTVAKHADAVVLLARWRRTSMRSVDAALDLLISVGASVAGVALAQVNVAKFGSSREELYGYQKQFKGYYTE
jgi:capsular exopolysaccharide synthesis family protein